MNADARLLRNLAEDVPDMAMVVREQLRDIAAQLESWNHVGTIRCERCGHTATVSISAARISLPPNAAPQTSPREPDAALRRALAECVAKVGDYIGMGPLGGTPVQYLLAIRDVAQAALDAAPQTDAKD